MSSIFCSGWRKAPTCNGTPAKLAGKVPVRLLPGTLNCVSAASKARFETSAFSWQVSIKLLHLTKRSHQLVKRDSLGDSDCRSKSVVYSGIVDVSLLFPSENASRPAGALQSCTMVRQDLCYRSHHMACNTLMQDVGAAMWRHAHSSLNLAPVMVWCIAHTV